MHPTGITAPLSLRASLRTPITLSFLILAGTNLYAMNEHVSEPVFAEQCQRYIELLESNKYPLRTAIMGNRTRQANDLIANAIPGTLPLTFDALACLANAIHFAYPDPVCRADDTRNGHRDEYNGYVLHIISTLLAHRDYLCAQSESRSPVSDAEIRALCHHRLLSLFGKCPHSGDSVSYDARNELTREIVHEWEDTILRQCRDTAWHCSEHEQKTEDN